MRKHSEFVTLFFICLFAIFGAYCIGVLIIT